MLSTDAYISRPDFEDRVRCEMSWGSMQWAGPSPGVCWDHPNFNHDRPSVASIVNVYGRDKEQIAQFVSTGMGAGGDQWGFVRYDNFISYDPKWDLPENGAW